MQKSELIAQLRTYLDEQGEVSSNAAPGLKLLRHCFVQLEKDDPAPAAVALPPARNAMLEEFAYGMLAELSLVPEIDDEPVSSWQEAIELRPDLPEEAISQLAETSNELAQLRDFADAIRHLLGDFADATLDGLMGQLNDKARYIASLEQGITDRDNQIAESDRHTQALNQLIADVAGASGISSTESLNKLPEFIRMEFRKRNDAYEELSRFRALLISCIEVLDIDWQDVDQLPSKIGQLERQRNAAQDMLLDGRDEPSMADSSLFAPTLPTSWVNDAIDLAHAVAGNLAPENRVMAKAAKAVIENAPREVSHD